MGLIEFGRFARGTAVIPQDHWAQRGVVSTEANGAMHLAGKADTLDASERGAMRAARARQHVLDGTNPVRRILFGQTGSGTGNGKRLFALRQHDLIIIDYD